MFLHSTIFKLPHLLVFIDMSYKTHLETYQSWQPQHGISSRLLYLNDCAQNFQMYISWVSNRLHNNNPSHELFIIIYSLLICEIVQPKAKVHDNLSTYVCHLMPRHAIYIRMRLTDLHTCLHIFLSNQKIGQFNPRLIEPTLSLWFGKMTHFWRFELLTTLVKIWPMPMLIDAVTIATITLNSCSPASNPQTDTLFWALS